jgi:hypothetical protein
MPAKDTIIDRCTQQLDPAAVRLRRTGRRLWVMLHCPGMTHHLWDRLAWANWSVHAAAAHRQTIRQPQWPCSGP